MSFSFRILSLAFFLALNTAVIHASTAQEKYSEAFAREQAVRNVLRADASSATLRKLRSVVAATFGSSTGVQLRSGFGRSFPSASVTRSIACGWQ